MLESYWQVNCLYLSYRFVFYNYTMSLRLATRYPAYTHLDECSQVVNMKPFLIFCKLRAFGCITKTCFWNRLENVPRLYQKGTPSPSSLRSHPCTWVCSPAPPLFKTHLLLMREFFQTTTTVTLRVTFVSFSLPVWPDAGIKINTKVPILATKVTKVAIWATLMIKFVG